MRACPLNYRMKRRKIESEKNPAWYMKEDVWHTYIQRYKKKDRDFLVLVFRLTKHLSAEPQSSFFCALHIMYLVAKWLSPRIFGNAFFPDRECSHKWSWDYEINTNLFLCTTLADSTKDLFYCWQSSWKKRLI